MTVLNGIEIDVIEHPINPTKEAILNNEPIDHTLHVIAVVSNPALFARRYILAKQFIQRMEQESNVILYIVELAYGSQQFYITDDKNLRHLQLRTDIPLWHKENMVNVGVRKLLPPTWKAMAWIDADVEFESATWALDTLKILNGYKDIVQVFSHALDMDPNESTMRVFNAFGFQHEKRQIYNSKDPVNYWHPGYAWAITKKAYDKLGGLYEYGILGSGDNIMSFTLIKNGLKSINHESTSGYKQSIISFETKSKTLRLGYVPGVIRHHFHGNKKDRKYVERWQILVDHSYDPYTYLTRDENGLIIPNGDCPKEMLVKIDEYFHGRNEDI
jgi:hypothetical protein